MNDIHRIIDSLQTDMTETLKRWITIPSVKVAPIGNAPYGAEVDRALKTALTDAQKLGFSTRDIEGHAGDVRMGPLGADPLGILAHLDIVPAGDGWQMDPFGAIQEGDRIYGRGTSDNKGPAVAALYAMYAVKQAGIPLRREVRLILGCDEESGMEDMAYYEKHYGLPQTGFSPDATFPVINTEKGLMRIELKGDAAKDGLYVKDIHAGERFNVVPGSASALIAADAVLCKKIHSLASEMHLQIQAEPETEDTIRITSTGLAGHAAYPEVTRNAIGQLLLILRALGVTGPLKTLADCVGMEYNGLNLGIRCLDETSGALTCNLGILRYNDSGLYATLDIRYPLLASADRILSTIAASIGSHIIISQAEQKEPHHVAPNSQLVTALLDAYHEETGRKRECLAIGGGTYARCIKEGVAFGSAFPEDEELAHQAGEYITISCLMQNVRIFANAIIKLAAL